MRKIYQKIAISWIRKLAEKDILRNRAFSLQKELGNFFYVQGVDLHKLSLLSGVNLSKKRGLSFLGYQKKKYDYLKELSSCYLCVFDVLEKRVLFATPNAKENIEAASLSKVCVSMSALDKNEGILPFQSDYLKMMKLLVDSDNDTWDRIQDLAEGKNGVNEWSWVNGYNMRPACVGVGNNIVNAYDMCLFWGDVLCGKYKGSEIIFRLSSACNTHNERSLKYMPSDCFIGGKTGTFEKANHDTCWIMYEGKFYVISVLTLLGATDDTQSAIADEEVAILFRGLFDEYVRK